MSAGISGTITQATVEQQKKYHLPSVRHDPPFGRGMYLRFVDLEHFADRPFYLLSIHRTDYLLFSNFPKLTKPHSTHLWGGF